MVASLGTALTINQARLLKRYADKVVISYDADLAGQMATIRGLEILRSVGFDVRVLNIPQGKDPDEFVRKNGKEAFLKLINDAAPLIDYRIKNAEEGINFKDSESTILYAKRIMEIIADLNPIEKDVYIRKASENTGIKEQTLYDILRGRINENEKVVNNINNINNMQKLYVEPAYVKAERALIILMLKNREFIEYIEDKIGEDDFNLPEHRLIFTIIINSKGENINNIESYVESKLSDTKSIEELIKIKESNMVFTDEIEKQVLDFVKEIKTYKLKQQIEVLKRKQKSLENEGKIQQSIDLAIEISKITRMLKDY